MKPSAYLLNAARGRVVDEPALVDALARQQIRGAALDVTVEELLPTASPSLADSLYPLPQRLLVDGDVAVSFFA